MRHRLYGGVGGRSREAPPTRLQEIFMKDRIKCSEQNRVIIRIWSSGWKGGENVGHISVETTMPKNYMSLWPSQRKTSSSAGFFQDMATPISPDFKADYKADVIAERRKCDITLCLYSLKSSRINKEFNSFLEEIKSSEKEGKPAGWRLIGSNWLVSLIADTGKAAESCASLAYRLLNAGGLYDLISSAYSLGVSSSVVPDVLGKMTKVAKKKELEKYPETQDFHFDSETLGGVVLASKL